MASTSVDVTLPFNSLGALNGVTSATLRRREFHHEMLIVETFNQNATSLDLRTGDPVSAVLKGHAQPSTTFVGYVHEMRSKVHAQQPRTHQVICVGATWVMKQPQQRVWQNTTISNIARTILREHNLTADVEDHDTVLPQVNQAAESDWAFLCRLAQEYGYICYPTGVVVHFHSRGRDLNRKQRAAYVLEYSHESFGQRSPVHEFNPRLSDTPEAGKARSIIRNVDPRTGREWAYSDDGSPDSPTRQDSRAAIFNRYLTDTVANYPSEAQTRLLGKQDRDIWNHKATAVLDGYTGTMPSSVLYLKGLKGNYDGYWNVIAVDHVYNNRDAYRMHATLGINDLGAPLAAALPGVLVQVDTDRLPAAAPTAMLVAPGGLSAPELLANRGGPDGMRWRGGTATLEPPTAEKRTPWFVRRKHRYAGH